MRAISPELQSLHSVAAAVLDPNGRLLEASEGFMRLLGTAAARRIGAEVSSCFSMPGFRELMAAQPMASGEVYRGTMRFRGRTGETVELRGRVWRSAYGLCVLAEADVLPAGTAQRVSEAIAHMEAQPETPVREAALTDALTGTGNSDMLDQALTTEIARVRRTGLPLSVLVAGPDGFEQFRAKLSPEGMNSMLARFGFLLRLLTRPSDIAARRAESEFAVVMPQTNLAQGATAAERIRKAVETDAFESTGDSVTASFGIAEYQAGEDAATFLERAGAALRSARKAGSNRVFAKD